MRPRAGCAVLFFIVVVAMASPAAAEPDAASLYRQMLSTWDPEAEEDGINLCYLCIFLLYADLSSPGYDMQQKAMACAERILSLVQDDGEVLRYPGTANVNSKLITGLGAWALSVAYWYTGDETYAEAARRAADWLMKDMDAWERTYPTVCDDPRTLVQRNGGRNETCLTSYCYTSPNDLGLVGLGIGAVVCYGAGKEPYYGYALKLADALYDMQLKDGSWYDGYALRIPTRWDRSTHYVTMAMMGLWMAYKISGDPRYASSLEGAWAWMAGMQASSGAVYDLWVDDGNLSKVPAGVSNACDFLQVAGQTDVKEYYASPAKTYLGEFSFVLAGAFLTNAGLVAPGDSRTAAYLAARTAYSNWYILSAALRGEEPVRPLPVFGAVLSLGQEHAGASLVPQSGGHTVVLAGALIVVAIALGAAWWRRRRP